MLLFGNFCISLCLSRLCSYYFFHLEVCYLSTAHEKFSALPRSLRCTYLLVFRQIQLSMCWWLVTQWYSLQTWTAFFHQFLHILDISRSVHFLTIFWTTVAHKLAHWYSLLPHAPHVILFGSYLNSGKSESKWTAASWTISQFSFTATPLSCSRKNENDVINVLRRTNPTYIEK